jgi:phosphoglucosamine mutase
VQFGTDGLRGRADEEITVGIAFRLGLAVASVFADEVCFVGRDTRESSPKLAAAVLAGVSANGGRGVNLGVITTPGVAVIAEERGGVGVVVSASHNPYFDNGLKVLGRGGTKLDLDVEEAVQVEFNRTAFSGDGDFDEPAVDHQATSDYLERLITLESGRDLAGLRVVLDCANGAASALAPRLFEALGADVAVIHASPDGRNINANCGSTHPQELARVVVATGADLGLAFDGDADRLVAVDATGQVRDGDDLLVLFANDLKEFGGLGGAIVVTSMSNLGLRRAMRARGIEVIEVDVGDRNVLVALEERDLFLGGEQSGHLIFRGRLPTGDGMLSGILLADLVRRRGPLAELCDQAWHRVPQRLLNIPVDQFHASAVDESVSEVRAATGVSDDEMRLVVRPSGTEPVMRVMVEALDAAVVDGILDGVARRCGLNSAT